jgi:predicted TIM-barrel fold metal-dependent hydrolase
MRIVALEEHFWIPEIIGRISSDRIRAWGWPAEIPPHMRHGERLADLGGERIAAMDEAGIGVQILSAAGPGADLLEGADAVRYARDYNDRLAEHVRRRPDRLGGFAHLPVGVPEAAADELERCTRDLDFRGAMINGMIGHRFLDHRDFEPLLARAEALDVPLYLHPGLPPAAVRDAYFTGLPGDTGFLLSIAGWGWHAETALHVLRLVLAGTFDRHPRLKMIVGHMGEGLPAMLARCDRVFSPVTDGYLRRAVSRTLLDQLWITTSGFSDVPSFMAAFLAFGADRILFSVDWPYAPNLAGRHFLDTLPVSPADVAKIAHGNADLLLKLAD